MLIKDILQQSGLAVAISKEEYKKRLVDALSQISGEEENSRSSYPLTNFFEDSMNSFDAFDLNAFCEYSPPDFGEKKLKLKNKNKNKKDISDDITT